MARVLVISEAPPVETAAERRHFTLMTIVRIGVAGVLSLAFSVAMVFSSVGPARASEPIPVLASETGEPISTPEPTPTPEPEPTPTPEPEPTPTPAAPRSLNLYRGEGFRYQGSNYAACTATSALSMLNFMAIGRTGGDGFGWRASLSSSRRDAILRWSRGHDTMLRSSVGTDPHGWRNALNWFGWGSLRQGARVYDDMAFNSYESAIKTAVRQMIRTRKSVGMLGWRGRHAQMITGYYGLRGNPFARDSLGRFTNAFSVDGLYVSDPLRSNRIVNRAVSYSALAHTTNYQVRFQRYRESDSPHDDPYTTGSRSSKSEWYGRYVLVVPVR